MALIVHPHFHSRRTGVTRHVESAVRALNGTVKAKVIGSAVMFLRLSWQFPYGMRFPRQLSKVNAVIHGCKVRPLPIPEPHPRPPTPLRRVPSNKSALERGLQPSLEVQNTPSGATVLRLNFQPQTLTLSQALLSASKILH